MGPGESSARTAQHTPALSAATWSQTQLVTPPQPDHSMLKWSWWWEVRVISVRYIIGAPICCWMVAWAGLYNGDAQVSAQLDAVVGHGQGLRGRLESPGPGPRAPLQWGGARRGSRRAALGRRRPGETTARHKDQEEIENYLQSLKVCCYLIPYFRKSFMRCVLCKYCSRDVEVQCCYSLRVNKLRL